MTFSQRLARVRARMVKIPKRLRKGEHRAWIELRRLELELIARVKGK
jgi:hypothetical protein